MPEKRNNAGEEIVIKCIFDAQLEVAWKAWTDRKF